MPSPPRTTANARARGCNSVVTPAGGAVVGRGRGGRVRGSKRGRGPGQSSAAPTNRDPGINEIRYLLDQDSVFLAGDETSGGSDGGIEYQGAVGESTGRDSVTKKDYSLSSMKKLLFHLITFLCFRQYCTRVVEYLSRNSN